MTREEAIANLNMISVAFVEPVTKEQRKLIDDTFDMAIKALEQEPSEKDWRFYYDHGYAQAKRDLSCEDAISRQVALKELKESAEHHANDSREEALLRRDRDIIRALPSVKQEPSVVFVKTEESNDNDTKYLNINVSDAEVKRNPDIVRLCSDVGILEYAKPQTGHWIRTYPFGTSDPIYECPYCKASNSSVFKNYCPNCGAKLVNPNEGYANDWIGYSR